MKKVVNSVLASALALSVAPMVVGAEDAATTAAPSFDTAAANRLAALQILVGNGSGDYKLGDKITRAEFATLIVRVRGLESGVKLAQNNQYFKDVNASNWFAGYVNVANGQELIKGYEDKTFRGNNNVTYAEAAAMIIRALGYEPSVKGTWPNNFIAKASQLGISDGVKVDPNVPALRGDIVKMLDNALSVDIMDQTSYGSNNDYKALEGETLLTKYLGIEVYDTTWANRSDNSPTDLPWVTNVPVADLGALKANEVELTGNSHSTGGKAKFTVASNINVNDFAGQQVQVWVKEGRENTVLWMEGSEDQEVLTEELDTFYLDDKVLTTAKLDDLKLGDLQLKLADGKKYDFAEKVKVSYNYNNTMSAEKAITAIFNDYDGYALGGDFKVKTVLNEDGDIAYLSVVDMGTADATSAYKYGSEVIETVNADKQEIEVLSGDKVSMKDKEEGEDFVVFLDGKLASLKDLKAFDVINVFYSRGDKAKKIIVATRTGNLVEGKVDAVDNKSTTDIRIKIGDKYYRMASSQTDDGTLSATYSENANKDIDVITTEEARDLDGQDVKLYLDATGKVRHIETKANIDDRRFKAVLTKELYHDAGKDEYSFEVFAETGKEHDFSIDEDDIKGTDGKKLTAAQIQTQFKLSDDLPVFVEVELDDKGGYESVKLVEVKAANKLSGDDFDKAADDDGDSLKVGNKTYDVAEDAVVFDMTGPFNTSRSRDELEDVNLAKFKSLANDDDKTVYFITDGSDAEYFFVVDGETSVESDGEYGVVNTTGSNSTGDYVTIIKKDGKPVDVYLDGDLKDLDDAGIGRRDFIRYTVNGAGEVIIDDIVRIVDGNGTPYKVRTNNSDDAKLDTLVSVQVTDVENGRIEFGTGNDASSLKVASDALYYDIKDLAGDVSIEEGDYVVLVDIDADNDSSNIDYVLFVADEEYVEENEYEDKMKDFLNNSDGGTTPDPDPVFVAPSFDGAVTGKEKNNAIVSTYTFTGKVKDFKAGYTLKATVGGRTANGTVDANGNITLSVISKTGETTGTVTVEYKDANNETKTISTNVTITE